MKSEKSLPQFDIVGPTIDDDVRRLIWRYGAENVQPAIRRRMARPRGRTSENDWPELRKMLGEDATTWLEGGDPFKARSNKSIARDFAQKRPGQSSESTHRRIMKKLRERRLYYTLVEAERLSESQYPFSENLRVLKALLESGIRRDLWQRLLWHHAGLLADYKSKFGEPPASMTMEVLLAAAAQPIDLSVNVAGNVLQTLGAVCSG